MWCTCQFLPEIHQNQAPSETAEFQVLIPAGPKIGCPNMLASGDRYLLCLYTVPPFFGSIREEKWKYFVAFLAVFC